MKDSARLTLIGKGLAYENVTKAKTNSAGNVLLEIAPRVEELENRMAILSEMWERNSLGAWADDTDTLAKIMAPKLTERQKEVIAAMGKKKNGA